jgi:hypothetical protein
MGSCTTCEIFNVWQQAADGYAQLVNERLSPYAMPFLGAVLAFYWSLKIVGYMSGQALNAADLGKEIMMTTVASTFLTFPSMWMYFVNVILNFGVSLAHFLVDPNGSGGGSGIAGLLDAIDQPLDTILEGVRAIMAGTGWTEIALFIGAFLLFLVYALLWLLITWDAIWFYTKFILIQVLGPIILVALAVPATRGVAAQAWKILRTAVLEFATLGTIIGLANYLLKLALNHMPLDASGKVTGDAADYLFGTSYLTALFCGALLILLRAGFKHLAAQLADAVADTVQNPLAKLPYIGKAFG